jgi:hypothetical protein
LRQIAIHRQILEAMTTSEYEKTFIERIYDHGFAQGRAKGAIREMAAGLLGMLDVRGLAPSQEQRERVTGCIDIAQQELWFRRALKAATAAEVFTD